ncbi:MAG: hypothetical protein JWP72_1112 [Massilia sp.]|nr:hypothetical protein [Massilia sp.]MDB5790830.1 hypothetical protein [Massilia sp.]
MMLTSWPRLSQAVLLTELAGGTILAPHFVVETQWMRLAALPLPVVLKPPA